MAGYYTDFWLPKNDRGPVLKHWAPSSGVLLDSLPLNYDNVTLQTIERIDVIWLKVARNSTSVRGRAHDRCVFGPATDG